MDEAISHAVNVLGIAGSIGTVLALAALSLLISYLLAAQWLRGRSDLIKTAIDNSDNEALARLTGGARVSVAGLSPEKKFEFAMEELRTRARQRTIAIALAFFAFLALLGFAFALATLSGSEKDDTPASPDLLAALGFLQHVPREGRLAACATLLSEAECQRAAPVIAGLTYIQPTAEQSDAIERTLETGVVTQSDLQELAACGGRFDFRVSNNLLECADGTPLPALAIATQGRPMSNAPIGVVFHFTGTGNQSFSSIARFLVEGRPGTSLRGPLAHLLVSRSGAIAQAAPFNVIANHAGRTAPWNGVDIRNGNSLGVELINSGTVDQDPYTPAQIAASEAIVRALVKQYGNLAIVGHSEIASPPGRKNDPGPHFPINEMRQVAARALQP
jgi:N-acetylmuramoyl-L-alanine amidase